MERIKRHLAFEDLPYRKQMLAKTAIRQLLNTLGYVDNADEFTGKLIEEQNEFLDWASKPNSLRRLNAKTVDFYKVVLEVALEDSVNASEFRLLERFRLKLGITRRGHRITEFQCIDNALVEAMNGLYKTEMVKPHCIYETLGDLEWVTRLWVDWFNN